MDSDAMLALALGEDPAAGKYGPALVLDTVAPEVEPHLTANAHRRIEFVLRRLSFAALRQVAQHIDENRWREACTWVTCVLEYSEALNELVTLTGSDLSGIPGPLTALVPAIQILDRYERSSNFAPGFRTAILGLVGAALTWTRRRARSAQESAALFALETPKLRAMSALARTMPEEWRPALALGSGPVFLAQLPDAEREQLIEHTKFWVEAHPRDAKLIHTVSSVEIGPAA